MRSRAKKNTKVRRKIRNIFAILNLLIFIVIIAVIIFYFNGIISGKAVAEFEEGGNIKDYYQKTLNMDYVEGFEKEIEFFIFNTEHKNMKVLLSIEGDLNESAELYENLIDFLPSETSRRFSYRFKIPENIKNIPGSHEVRIIALEVPNILPGEGYTASVSKTVSEINVYVPYPGKYIEADLDVQNADENAVARFVIAVENRGKLEIEEVKANIDIYTILGEKVTSIFTNSESLRTGTVIELSSDWDVNSLPGDYIAKFSVFYDEETREFEKKFAIGAKNLSIEGLSVSNFQLGGIARLQILADNKWNQELKEVYANLIVYDSDGQIMADIKSATESIPALSKKELIAYWDTGNVDEGEYSSKLSIKYENNSADKELVFRVSQDSLDVFGIGYVIRPKIMQGSTMTMMLIILVIILLIVNLAWFVFFRRTMWKRKN